MNRYLSLWQLECRAFMKHRALWSQAILFYMLLLLLFLLGELGDFAQLFSAHQAVLWLVFLLTIMFNVEMSVNALITGGRGLHYVLSPHPLWALIIMKASIIWLVTTIPILLCTAALGWLGALSWHELLGLEGVLALASPALVFIAVMIKSLTLQAPRSGLLMGLLLFPLYVPLFILGQSALNHSAGIGFQMSLLAAFSVFAMVLCPLATAGALRESM